jgi:hypothetical protein
VRFLSLVGFGVCRRRPVMNGCAVVAVLVFDSEMNLYGCFFQLCCVDRLKATPCGSRRFPRLCDARAVAVHKNLTVSKGCTLLNNFRVVKLVKEL